jgi:hypothetical protein
MNLVMSLSVYKAGENLFVTDTFVKKVLDFVRVMQQSCSCLFVILPEDNLWE